MKFIDKIKHFFKDLIETININEEEDFNATFEEHEIGDQKFYRLHYINYHNIDRDPNRRGEIDYRYKPFELPIGMTREDAFKVLSYLTDFIEKRPEVYEASWKSVGTLDSVLNLERFGFKRLDFTPIDDEIIDLFTIDGRFKRFKSSEYYEKYFNWYTKGITKKEVEEIYQKCGMTFRDIVWLDRSTKEQKLTDKSSEEQNTQIENKNMELQPKHVSNTKPVQKVKVRKKVIKENKNNL